MATLNEVLEMFGKFGFSEAEVRRFLATGSSAFNAFEGLKLQLKMRWADLPPNEQEELRSVYDRLLGINMKSRITAADRNLQEERKKVLAFQQFRDEMSEAQQRQQWEFFGMVREQLRKFKREGKLDAADEARARQAGLFGPDEEI